MEFFKIFWEVIGGDFFQMIQENVNKGRLPPGVTQGKIALLYKGGPCHELINW